MDPFSATHQIIRDITVVLVGAIVFIGYPLARAYAKRLGNAPPEGRLLASAEVTDARMERIERAVEAMSLEVERMAEGQRFMTKLLGDPGRGKPPAVGGGPELGNTESLDAGAIRGPGPSFPYVPTRKSRE